MLITLFTPTYNRAHLLGRLYLSIKQQRFNDFEWIIVDDGSTDNTHDVVMEFIEEGVIPIKYVFKRNGGKHRAINEGVRQASGDLFFIVDSDDVLADNALKRIVDVYEQIKADAQFGGVAGIDAYPDGRVVGSGLPAPMIDCNSLEIRSKHHVVGDLSEVFRTQVMREFPFPEIDGEKFCPEALIWNRIARKYKLRYFNEPIYIAEYQPEGLTARIVEIRMKSPIATTMCYAEMVMSSIPLKERFKAAANYWRFRCCSKDKNKIKHINVFWRCMFLLGWIMHLRDLRVTKK
ncbi:glycosyltransferase family 2 protein [Hoylesella shahii]|uniref:glycosyltransferase family 2 protein n=1 Tax=Hoylesella shahii TaxID=228603 RepID=UPI001CB29C10|nr:glycosyltransferase family A protein [Hoylesella shahii]MBF1575799.1 glycosyltransferase family 2 protein [Hoylesella shahii]